MDELEVKAAKLLENSKEATIKETKSMIDAEAKSLTEKLDAETKSRGELAIKFEAIESELKEVKSESQRLKVAAETKTTTWSEGLKSAFDDASNLTNLQEFKDKKIKQFTMEVKAVGDMSLSNISGLSAANVEMLPGIVPFPSRKLHIRQLLPIGQMSTSDIHFLQETQDEGTVAVWADNSGAKNQVDFDLTEEVAQSQFIAGYLRITRKMLDDIPAMRSFLQARLIERYLNAEDQQLLSGNGVSPQLDGLITNAQAYSGTRTIAVEKIIDACAQVEGNNYQATGILLSPKQYYAILMTKGSTLDYSLPGGSAVNIVNGQIYIAGVPVFKSTALFTQLPAQDTFLVGDWAMGAQLFIRENPIVRFFEEDGTNVRENKITVRVEGRVAMPIYSPTAFVTGSLNPTPS
jgi:HK97 family phage major capsid protein